jgi:multicomponent Na+:H+ antiporter subunit B
VSDDPRDLRTRMREKQVLVVVSRIAIPFILLFALYVQFHGDFGPGGGFQAGVLFAAGLILFGLVIGPDELSDAMHPRLVEIGIALGVVLYGGTGLVSLALGGNFLDYGVLAHDPVHGQHLGIMLVELGVALTVASAMLGIYLAFVEFARREL